MNVSVYISQAI